ncbi:beta-hexosaminidase [Bacillus sp. JCM 19046]|nr:beta-hexosaminidase [Bacillus sp. JCM 19046]
MSKPSLDEMLGQLLVVGFPGKQVPEEMEAFMKEHKIGNIILFARNMGTPEEVQKLTSSLQRIAKKSGQELPLLISVDQENGVVRRLGQGTTLLPGAMALAATYDPENAYHMHQLSGRELVALGINWNLAPVLDVNNNPENPVIGVRSFGEDPHKVALYGKQAMAGLQKAGMVTTLKHFPGHGDTNVDSHLGLPRIDHSLERLKEVELYPFQACIDAGADTIMSAHIYFPALEEKEGVPATLSKKILTDLLRNDMGFEGVVTTDCMEMDAITKTIGTEKGCVEAIKAGVDLVMVSHSIEKQKGALEQLKRAVEDGEIPITRIEEAYRRILAVKQKYLLNAKEYASVPASVGGQVHQDEAMAVYEKSVTIEQGANLIPLSARGKRILVIEPPEAIMTRAEDKHYAHAALGLAVQSIVPHADVKQMPLSTEQLSALAHQYDTIVIGLLSASQQKEQQELLHQLVRFNFDVHVVAMRSPYDYNVLPDGVGIYINTYEFSYPALEVAAKALFGKHPLTGTSPVTLIKSERNNK